MGRYKSKEEMERLEEEELKSLEKKNKMRRKAVEVKEQRTEEQEEYELAQLRLRWKATFQEKDRLLQEARKRREKEKNDAKNQQDAVDKRREESEAKRQVYFGQLATRIKAKDDSWLKRVLEKKQRLNATRRFSLSGTRSTLKSSSMIVSLFSKSNSYARENTSLRARRRRKPCVSITRCARCRRKRRPK